MSHYRRATSTVQPPQQEAPPPSEIVLTYNEGEDTLDWSGPEPQPEFWVLQFKLEGGPIWDGEQLRDGTETHADGVAVGYDFRVAWSDAEHNPLSAWSNTVTST